MQITLTSLRHWQKRVSDNIDKSFTKNWKGRNPLPVILCNWIIKSVLKEEVP